MGGSGFIVITAIWVLVIEMEVRAVVVIVVAAVVQVATAIDRGVKIVEVLVVMIVVELVDSDMFKTNNSNIIAMKICLVIYDVCHKKLCFLRF